jgi:hypothetical protein
MAIIAGTKARKKLSDLQDQVASLKTLVRKMGEMLNNELEYGYQMTEWEALKSSPEVREIMGATEPTTPVPDTTAFVPSIWPDYSDEYVWVRREDLELLRHYKTTSVLGGPSLKEADAVKRIDAALQSSEEE